MKLVELEEMVKALGNDAELYDYEDGTYDLTFNDFEGFDEDWSEIFREYDHPEEVDALERLLDELPHEGDFYVEYQLEDCVVTVGYTSFDI